jgi:phosphoesterase RecJ-like protein
MSVPIDDVQRAVDALSGCRRVLVTTHVRPDGDALGSAAAMVLGMRQKGVASEVLLLSHPPRKYAFVFGDYGVAHIDVEKGFAAGFSLDGYDALVVVDTGTWSQLPGLRERVEGWGRPTIVIDHHLTQEGWAEVKVVETGAAAAAEIVAEVLGRWGVEIDAAIASALYLGIVSDTGWFAFSNTRPRTLRLAAELVEKGVDTDRMYQALYQNERAERLALQTRAQGSLELLLGGRLAVMRVTARDFGETGASVADTENLINVPLQVATVEVSVLAVEPPEGGAVRVSLRSRGQVDVARFAEQFGGGGHARAAGLKLEMALEQAVGRVVDAMRRGMEGK